MFGYSGYNYLKKTQVIKYKYVILLKETLRTRRKYFRAPEVEKIGKFCTKGFQKKLKMNLRHSFGTRLTLYECSAITTYRVHDDLQNILFVLLETVWNL